MWEGIIDQGQRMAGALAISTTSRIGSMAMEGWPRKEERSSTNRPFSTSIVGGSATI